MPIELYKPVELATGIENSAPAVGFLSQLFKFKDEYLHGTEEFLLDKVKEGVGVSTYVNRNGDYKKVPNDGYLTNKFKPGYIKEEMSITSADLRDRDAGVPNLLGKQSPASKLPMKIGKQFKQLDNRVQRTLEMQASQGLTTGVVSIEGDGVKYDVDFELAASHKFTANPLWSAATTATPIDDLNEGAQIISDEAATPGVNLAAIMSVDSFKAMKATTQFKEEFDNRRFESGLMKPKMINALGAKYQGYLTGFGEIWTYSRKYRTAANVEANYMPDKTVLIVDLDSDFQEHYGVVENMDASAQGFKAKRFPMSYKKDKGQGIDNTLECAPLMSPVQLEGVVVLTTLA